MAALEAALFSNFSFTHLSSLPKSLSLCPTTSSRLRVSISSNSTPTISLKSLPTFSRKFEIRSAIQEIAIEEEKPEQTQQTLLKRKLFVLNLPWTYSVADLKNLFGECGTVTDVEIIKQKNGKSRGFAFVTMASGEEAQAVVDKFDSHELLGRIIRVEFAKRFKKPPPPPPEGPPPTETRYKLYVSNLAWKVRATHLREFFAANFKPVSARVVFDSPTGRSAGYGFVSFASKEEADAAISTLNGKELFDRPISLKVSERNIDESEIKVENASDEQPVDS